MKYSARLCQSSEHSIVCTTCGEAISPGEDVFECERGDFCSYECLMTEPNEQNESTDR